MNHLAFDLYDEVDKRVKGPIFTAYGTEASYHEGLARSTTAR